jgi:hypothetical protein
MGDFSTELLLLGTGVGILIGVLAVIARASTRHERGGGDSVPSKPSLGGPS